MSEHQAIAPALFAQVNHIYNYKSVRHTAKVAVFTFLNTIFQIKSA